MAAAEEHTHSEGFSPLLYDLAFVGADSGKSVPGVRRYCPDKCCTTARGRTFALDPPWISAANRPGTFADPEPLTKTESSQPGSTRILSRRDDSGRGVKKVMECLSAHGFALGALKYNEMRTCDLSTDLQLSFRNMERSIMI